MTDNIVTKIYERIKCNPSALSQIDWLDVEVYCTSCVAGREHIYPSDDYQSLNDMMHRLCMDIRYAAECEDYSSALFSIAELSGIISAMPEINHYKTVILQAVFDNMLLEHLQKGTSVIMGDSHVNFFSGHELQDYTDIGYGMHWCKTINNLPLTAIHVGPGLAYNCMKYGTTSKFREKTEFLLSGQIKPGSRLLITLGEVDCRAHVFKQAQLQNRDYHEIVDDITDNYIAFLKSIRDMGYTVGCWGPIASQSEDLKIDPNDHTYPRFGSEVDRNMATEYFNNRLADLCHKSDIIFLSIFDQLIDDNYKTKQEFISSDGVHLSQSAMPLALPLLKENGYI